MIKPKQCFIDFSWRTEFGAKMSWLFELKSLHPYYTKCGKKWYMWLKPKSDQDCRNWNKKTVQKFRSKDWDHSFQNSPWQLVNAKAFAEAYLCVLVSASGKKNAEAIKFLGILEKILFLE